MEIAKKTIKRRIDIEKGDMYDRIVCAIEDFEEETGLLVEGITIRREHGNGNPTEFQTKASLAV